MLAKRATTSHPEQHNTHDIHRQIHMISINYTHDIDPIVHMMSYSNINCSFKHMYVISIKYYDGSKVPLKHMILIIIYTNIH